MWNLMLIILYLTCVQSYLFFPENHTDFIKQAIKDRTMLASNYDDSHRQRTSKTPKKFAVRLLPEILPVRQSLDYLAAPSRQNYPFSRPHFTENPNNHQNNGRQNPDMIYFLNRNHFHQPEILSKIKPYQEDIYPYEIDSYDPDKVKSSSDEHSFFDDLELVENFENYLRRRTQLEGLLPDLDVAVRQYNVLLYVLMGLARTIRHSCADFEEVYDKVYKSVVETYYVSAWNNADEVWLMIEEYISKGKSHILKLRNLKEELCELEQDCSAAFNNKIENSAVFYAKELESLEALANLARSFYSYIEEFNQAALRGVVYDYLINNKDRLKEYVMHIVNGVEHISDEPLKCTSVQILNVLEM